MNISLFSAGEGWQIGFESIKQSGKPSDVEYNPKLSILFFFLAGEGWQMGFVSIDQPSQSSEIEYNPKMSILFFGWIGVVEVFQVHQ